MISLLLFTLLATTTLSFPLNYSKNVMSPVPFYDSPSLKSVVNYVKPMTETAAVSAQVNIEASIPSIHLINIPDIISLECTNFQLILQTTPKSLALIREWEVTRTLLIVDHSFGCRGYETIMFTTTSWKFVSDLAVFDITPLTDHSGVTGDIQIEIRSIDLLDKGNSKLTNQTLVYPFTFAKTFDKRINLGSSNSYLKCEECKVSGEVDLVSIVSGSLFDLENLHIVSYLKGNLFASFKLNGGLDAKTSNNRINLFHLDFIHAQVPGLFDVSPSFDVYSYVTVDSSDELEFQTSYSSIAKNFAVKLVQIGSLPAQATADLLKEPFMEFTSAATPQVLLSKPQSDLDVSFRVGLEPTLSLKAAYAGSKTVYNANTGVLGLIKTDLKVRVNDQKCKSHVTGYMEGQVIMTADVGTDHRVLKEGHRLKLAEGCF